MTLWLLTVVGFVLIIAGGLWLWSRGAITVDRDKTEAEVAAAGTRASGWFADLRAKWREYRAK